MSARAKLVPRARGGRSVKPKEFVVSLDEIAQSFVFGERFVESYTKTVTMSDGATRTITLTPMIRNGEPVVRLDDGGHVSYLGRNGSHTNGNLLVRIHEIPEEL